MPKMKQICINVTEEEYKIIQQNIKFLKKELDRPIGKSSLARFILLNASNLQFLLSINFISYQEFMSRAMFPKKSKKYPRVKNCKK